MEEEEITDVIYGDLGDFECAEKLKEQNEEITSLTERLNQSVVTITDLQNQVKDLKKENRQLQKNMSSLLLTAKLELNRKQRDITDLNERRDNRIFRRPNRNSVDQTNVTIHPLVNGNNNKVTFTEQMNEQIGVETCIKNSTETMETSKSTYNDRNVLNTFRIPKKNPFARHIDVDETKNSFSVCNTEKLENSQMMITNDQQKRCHLPKKNPYARRLDVQEEKPDVTTGYRYENDIEKGKSKSRREDDRDNRKRSTSARHYDSKKSCSSDDQRRHRHNSRSRRKHSRGRSSSNEKDRHSKRFRSISKSNSHRSRSKSCNEEKHRQPKSPKKSSLKSRKDDTTEDMKPQQDTISNMKEKDLEAMLIAQKKILKEIDNQDNKEQGLNQNTPKGRHEPKLSTNEDLSEKLMNPERIDDKFNCANEAISNGQLISESKDSTLLAEKDASVDKKNINEIGVVPEVLEVPSVLSTYINELPPSVVGVPTTKFKSLSSLNIFSSPVKELMDKNDEVIIPQKTSQFDCNENSNSQMDIDYELMERTSAGSQINLTCQDKDLKEPVSTATTSPNKDKRPDSSFAHISASFIAVDNNVPCDGESNLNRSSERHILSKSCEYTVQDVGHEVVIFLTKKRKKNKKPNAMS